jgi:uncharacterized protein DUF29
MAVKEQHAAPSAVSPGAGYDDDFFQWTQSTAEMIRQGRLAEVDLEHIAEAELRGESTWRSTIVEQRTQLQLVIEDSPSLGRIPREELSSLFRTAVKRATEETGLRVDRFPSSCPYTAEQLLDGDFFPNAS